jgi:S-adenosylhomocysteine hydrolase
VAAAAAAYAADAVAAEVSPPPPGGTEPKPAGARGRVLDVPAAIDAEVASLALAGLGTRIDELTREQLTYLDSWRLGS